MVLLVSLVVVLGTSLSPPLMQILGSQFWQGHGVTQQSVSLLTAVGSFVIVLFILGSGVLGDLYGRKLVIAVLLSAQILLHIVGLLSSNAGTIASTVSILSVVSAMIHPLVLAALVTAYKGRLRVVALTLYFAVGSLSTILIPVVDNLLLNTRLAWLVFAMPLSVSVLGLILVWRFLPSRKRPSRPRPADVIAVALWAAAVCAAIYGLLLLVGVGVSSWLAWLFLVGGIAGIVLIGRLEAQPLAEEYRFVLYRERPLTVAIVSGVVLALTLKAIVAQLYHFFKDVQDAGIFVSALMLLPLLIGAVLLSVLVARIASQRRDTTALALGLVSIGLAALGLGILEPDIAYIVVAPLLLLTGFGYVLGNTPRVLLLSRSVPRQLESTVQAIGVATSQVGAAMAYTMTLNLILLFTTRIYEGVLNNLGLTQDAIERQLELVAVVTRATQGTPTEQQAGLIAAVVPAYEAAHVEAVSRTLFLLGVICLLTAPIVYLSVSEKDTDAAPISLPTDDTPATPS